MARTVNAAEHAARRSEILDAAQRLIYAKGYERMTIQDILNDLDMSSGAFYHYFKSKPAILEAMVERGQHDLDAMLLPIAADPGLSSVDKLRRFFDTIDRYRVMHRSDVLDAMRIWFADENAIFREKTDEVILKRRAPLLSAIVRQGVQEGVFTTLYPDDAGEIILSITRGMGNALLRLLIAPEGRRDEATIDRIVAISAAAAEAIERVLGASERILYRPDAEAVKRWLHENGNAGSIEVKQDSEIGEVRS